MEVINNEVQELKIFAPGELAPSEKNLLNSLYSSIHKKGKGRLRNSYNESSLQSGSKHIGFQFPYKSYKEKFARQRASESNYSKSSFPITDHAKATRFNKDTDEYNRFKDNRIPTDLAKKPFFRACTLKQNQKGSKMAKFKRFSQPQHVLSRININFVENNGSNKRSNSNENASQLTGKSRSHELKKITSESFENKNSDTEGKLATFKSYNSETNLPTSRYSSAALKKVKSLPVSNKKVKKISFFQDEPQSLSELNTTNDKEPEYLQKINDNKYDVDMFRSIYIHNGEDLHETEIKKALFCLLESDVSKLDTVINQNQVLEEKIKQLIENNHEKVRTNTFEGDSISLGHLKSLLFERQKLLIPKTSTDIEIVGHVGIAEKQEILKQESKSISSGNSADLKTKAHHDPVKNDNHGTPKILNQAEEEAYNFSQEKCDDVQPKMINQKAPTSDNDQGTSSAILGTQLMISNPSLEKILSPKSYYNPIALSLKSTKPKKFIFNTPLGEYESIKTLGQGSYGKVKLLRNTLTQVEYAVKIIKRYSPKRHKVSHPDYKKAITLDKRVIREANLSKILGQICPHITPLYNFRMTEKYFYLFYEYVDGPTLSERVGSTGISEEEAKLIFKPIAEAIKFCHSFSIIHRDIKLENVLIDYSKTEISQFNAINAHGLDSKAEKHSRRRGKIDIGEKYRNGRRFPIGFVKLIDFGLANYYTRDGHMETFCGSLPYTAPEILRGDKYNGPEIDVWSLGVLLYVMLNGKFPFEDPSNPKNFQKILDGDFELRSDLSIDLQKLLVMMLEPDVNKRLKIDQVLSHEWFKYNNEYENFMLKNCCPFHSTAGGMSSIIPKNSIFLELSETLNESVLREVATCFDISPESVYSSINASKIGTDTENSGNGKAKYLNSPLVSMYFLILKKLELSQWSFSPQETEILARPERDTEYYSQITNDEEQQSIIKNMNIIYEKEIKNIVPVRSISEKRYQSYKKESKSKELGQNHESDENSKSKNYNSHANSEPNFVSKKKSMLFNKRELEGSSKKALSGEGKNYLIVDGCMVRKIGYFDGAEERIMLPKKFNDTTPSVIMQTIYQILEFNGTSVSFTENVAFSEIMNKNHWAISDYGNNQIQFVKANGVGVLSFEELKRNNTIDTNTSKNDGTTEVKDKNQLICTLLEESSKVKKFSDQAVGAKIKIIFKSVFKLRGSELGEIDEVPHGVTVGNKQKHESLKSLASETKKKTGNVQDAKNDKSENEDEDERIKNHHNGTLPEGYIWKTMLVRGKNRRVMVADDEYSSKTNLMKKPSGRNANLSSKLGSIKSNKKGRNTSLKSSKEPKGSILQGIKASRKKEMNLISVPVNYPTTTLMAQHTPSLNSRRESEAMEHYSCTIRIEIVLVPSLTNKYRYAIIVTRVAGHSKKFRFIKQFLNRIINSL
ncbi:hypothetical protein BB560_005840 [Smittium megazygosporum]|uniref:Protein kinase domain-containing protein n=1 Tax=Smittium megazygosporum TaxID=133381 RepID=A0A2T9YU24_9FUNG|nr:hypothetical protein BB560_005840 [Smittium megazygosporum]